MHLWLAEIVVLAPLYELDGLVPYFRGGVQVAPDEHDEHHKGGDAQEAAVDTRGHKRAAVAAQDHLGTVDHLSHEALFAEFLRIVASGWSAVHRRRRMGERRRKRGAHPCGSIRLYVSCSWVWKMLLVRTIDAAAAVVVIVAVVHCAAAVRCALLQLCRPSAMMAAVVVRDHDWGLLWQRHRETGDMRLMERSRSGPHVVVSCTAIMMMMILRAAVLVVVILADGTKPCHWRRW